jgi:glutamine amidotransferase/cyclase
LSTVGDRRVYFVHSYRATPTESNADWVLATSEYGGDFVAAVQKGQVCAAQFHPEKSGAAGLDILRCFLDPASAPATPVPTTTTRLTGLAKRVIACLDVRANDAGDLVVTKGDQYDVREPSAGGEVRNLGKPVELARRYFQEGADEVTFLNITGFRDFPMEDLPMLEVLRQASEGVFVPLTVGGGIRGFTDGTGKTYSALEVAAEYFRSGADKISIGSDAVDAAQAWVKAGGVKDGSTAIEQISKVYGAQAVVVSIDPRRVYVNSPDETHHVTVKTAKPGPNGEEYCWWQCTVRGGREGRDVDAVQLAVIVQDLGAGEILLNCIDNDGVGQGFDLELVGAVADAVKIPVIASSGAGAPEHFSEVFEETHAAAALAAGIFHRQEVEISAVKGHMEGRGIPTRTS